MPSLWRRPARELSRARSILPIRLRWPQVRVLELIVGLTLLGGSATPVFAAEADVQPDRVPKEKIPPSPPLPPEQAIASFKLAPGLSLQLVASEPLIESPVAINFSSDGRL